MADTKSTESPRAVPAAALRRGLTVGGVGFAALNVVLMLAGSAGSPMVSAVLWGAAAVCFLGAFVAYMMEPVPKTEAADASSGKSRSTETRSTGPSTPVGADTGADAPADAKGDAPADDAASPTGDASDAATSGGDGEQGPLLRRGNPLRWTRGGITAALGIVFTLLLMAKSGQWRWGVPLGLLTSAIASWGLMDLVGTFDDGDERLARSTTLADLGGTIGSFFVTGVLFCLALGGAQAGVLLPQPVWGIVVTLAFVAWVAAFFALGVKLGPLALDDQGQDRPLWKRHGFWLIVISAALLLPSMGTYALWDPWETHYGEVSREMLARDDWISLWWAQDGWFWSKPVCDMWMQAISMATLGVHYQPDKMLVGDGSAPTMHPEWAVRTPVVLLTIVAVYLLYKGVSRTFGRRAAFIGGVVLATMPDWYFIAHQTMTDMPFVGAMTASMGLVLMGLRTPEDQQARAYEVKVGATRWRLTGWHLVFGTILLCAVPQILYLFTRNFDFLWRPDAHGFRIHWDEFRSGSGGGNCGLPGNEDCHLTWPASVPRSTGNSPDTLGLGIWRAIASFEPGLQAIVWSVVLGVLLYMSWGERRTRRLFYLAGWFFAAISTLAKGPAGFGLPMLVTFTYLCASRPGEELFARLQRIIKELTQFEIVAGLLVILAVAMPWYVAMYVRHGSPFTDRLIFHDMFNRAFHHVHDTNEGDDTSFRFYVWQLGYALFPWTGLAPLGLLWWMRRGSSQKENDRADASVLLCMWFVFGFALFSFMGTKFHHYIFPAVPPIAMLVGVVLDDMLGDGSPARARSLGPYLAGLAAGLSLLVLGVARLMPGSIFGSRPDGHLADPSVPMGVVLLVAGVAILAGSVRLFGSANSPAETGGDDDAKADADYSARMLAAGAASGALLLVLVTRDLVLKPENADQPGAIRLLQLFTYNYRRAWPESLDFSAALTGFGAVAIVVALALTVRQVRRHAVAAMCVAGVVWAAWGLDVYMEKTAQHWGQHEVIEAYYANRASPDETLVAYQMNWKGENFYTGNRIPAFVSTGSTFTTWLKKKKDEGSKVMFFITEHGRVTGMKNEINTALGRSGQTDHFFRDVTTKELCNKFMLVRAEL